MVSIRYNKIIFVIIGIVFFYALFAIYSDLNELNENFQKINFIYLIPILSILLFSQFLRGIIQKFLLNQINIKISLKESYFLFLSGLSMIISPGGTGQMIKSHFLKQKYGHSISKSSPVVFAERFYDLFAISILVSITLIFIFTIESLIAVFLSFILVMIFISITKNKKIFHNLIRFLNKIKYLKKILPDDSEFNDSLELLFKNNIIVKTVFFTLMVTFLEGFVIYLGFLSFDVDLGYLSSINLFYTSIMFGAISLMPGGIGVVEGSFTALLTQQSLPLSLAISIVIFIRLTTIWFSTMIGFLALFSQSRRKKIKTN